MHDVESTLIASDGTWKAEIFRRGNGTYGFRAMRWLSEEACWVEAGRFSESITSSLEAAELEARMRVPSLGRSARRIAGAVNEPESPHTWEPANNTMTLDDLIKLASSNKPLDLAQVESTARQLNLSVSDLIDQFARVVAIRYLRGDYTYEFADMAMNQLYGFAYPDNDIGFSDLAWEIFYAFDEGEYTHGDSALQGEELTRALLNRISSLRS